MKYTVGRDFIKLEETSGTIRNLSAETTIEMALKPVAGSGKLIAPGEQQSYRYHTVYLRCIDGLGEASCEPYDVDPKTRADGDAFVADGDYLHLTWDFPTGSNKTMLLRNPRPDLTISELQRFSEYTIEQDVFRNDFAEPTRGIKKIMMIKSMVRGHGGASTGGNTSDQQVVDDGDEQWWGGGQIDEDHPTVTPIIVPVKIPTTYFDMRRKLTRNFEDVYDMRRILSTDQTIFDVDLRRRVKWRWLTRILPDSSFLDSKMYAAADALDDQITLFHWAIRNVLHLPRLGELKGTILDLLADQFHVDAYDALNFTDEEKRELIRTSIAWHRIKGTPAAVEMVLGVAFKYYKIAEWFEYGGAPYYFRLYIKGTAYSPGSFQSFWRMFLDAKNVRSHLEKVFIDLSPDDPIKVYTGIFKVRTGNRKIPLPHLPPVLTPTRNIYTGIFKIIAGNILKRVLVPEVKTLTERTLYTGIVAVWQRKVQIPLPHLPPATIQHKLYTGVITIRRGTKTIGLYQAT